MLASSELTAFVPAVDMDRARAFFTGTLGLTVDETGPYADVYRVSGGWLRVVKVDSFTPQPFTITGWVVPDIRAIVGTLRGHGVQPLRFDGMTQDGDGVWTTPDGHLVMWFHDPEGNTLSCTQRLD